MQLHPRPFILRSTLVALMAVSFVGAAACSSDGSSDADSNASASETNSSTADAADDGAAGDAATADIDVPTEGTPFSEAMSDPEGSPDPDELQQALAVIGTDKPGYVSGTTIVAQPAVGDDRQFVCISVGVLDLETYTLVVLDDAGQPLDC